MHLNHNLLYTEDNNNLLYHLACMKQISCLTTADTGHLLDNKQQKSTSRITSNIIYRPKQSVLATAYENYYKAIMSNEDSGTNNKLVLNKSMQQFTLVCTDPYTAQCCYMPRNKRATVQ